MTGEGPAPRQARSWVAANTAHAFPPLEAPGARVLVLGSIPGRRSLAEQQYYAHPRNAFWPIMATLAGFDASLDYASRVSALTAAGVAVWDVFHTCERPGSLDSDIRADSVIVNDFAALLSRQPGLRLVCCNGATAASAWRRHVVPTLPASQASIAVCRLPSTSPAHAARTFSDKLQTWRDALGPLLRPP